MTSITKHAAIANQATESAGQVRDPSVTSKPSRPRRMPRGPGDGHDIAGTAPSQAPRRASKISQVVALLRRDEGATLDEMTGATGWLPHTTRAALTGLKIKGHAITKTKRGDVTCYHIAGEA